MRGVVVRVCFSTVGVAHFLLRLGGRGQAKAYGPGVVPDAHTYTVAMHALVANRDPAAALEVWGELLASGVRPTVPACGAALNAMAKNGTLRCS
jgi:pentatricopeptide repeat protein